MTWTAAFVAKSGNNRTETQSKSTFSDCNITPDCSKIALSVHGGHERWPSAQLGDVLIHVCCFGLDGERV